MCVLFVGGHLSVYVYALVGVCECWFVYVSMYLICVCFHTWHSPHKIYKSVSACVCVCLCVELFFTFVTLPETLIIHTQACPITWDNVKVNNISIR